MFIPHHIQCLGAGAFETAPRLGGAVVGTWGPAFRPEEEGAGCQQRDGRSARPAPEDQGQVTTHARIQYEHVLSNENTLFSGCGNARVVTIGQNILNC